MSSKYNDDIDYLKKEIKNLKIGCMIIIFLTLCFESNIPDKKQMQRERELESKLALSQDENRQMKELIRQSEYDLLLLNVVFCYSEEI
jgi:hypothetical protein